MKRGIFVIKVLAKDAANKLFESLKLGPNTFGSHGIGVPGKLVVVTHYICSLVAPAETLKKIAQDSIIEYSDIREVDDCSIDKFLSGIGMKKSESRLSLEDNDPKALS